MAFVTPTAESVATATGSQPNLPGQAVLDQTDIAIMVAGIEQTGVVSGCGVTASTGSGSLAVTVASGVYQLSGVSYSFAGASINSGWTASAYDRRDIITINSSGTLTLVQGTPTTGANWFSSSSFYPPVKPSIPAGSVVLAEVYIPGGISVLTQSDIVDKTFPISQAFVGSFNGRQGAVMPAVGDYTAQMVTGAAVAYNVKNYGAVGDGSTVDTTAITAAITAAGVGGTVYFPESTGPFMASNLAPLSGQTWTGPGTIKLVPSSSSPLITATGLTGWTCTGGLILDGNRSSASANSTGLVYLASPTGCNLVGVTLQNTQGATGSASTAAVMFRLPQSCGVVQCDFFNCGYGILMGSQYTDSTIMNDNVVLNCTFNTTDNDSIWLTENFTNHSNTTTATAATVGTGNTLAITAPGTFVKGGFVKFSSAPTGTSNVNTTSIYQITTGGSGSCTITSTGAPMSGSSTNGTFSWTNGLLHGTVVSGCAVIKTGDNGIEIGSGCVGTVLSGFTVDNTAVSTGNHAVLVKDAQNTVISGLSGTGLNQGTTSSLVSFASLNVVPQNTSINGFSCINCTQGIYEGAGVFGLSISSGTISGFNQALGSGINLVSGTSGVSISGVTITNGIGISGATPYVAGIFVGSSGACHDVTISGCTVLNHVTADGITISNGSYDVAVTGNRLGNNVRGIRILDTASYSLTIIGNDLTGNSSSSFVNNSTAATNLVQNNGGYSTFGVYNQTLNGTQAQLTGMTNDALVNVTVMTGGQMTIYVGPSTGTKYQVYSITAVAGQTLSYIVPLNWYTSITTSGSASWSTSASPV